MSKLHLYVYFKRNNIKLKLQIVIFQIEREKYNTESLYEDIIYLNKLYTHIK